MHLLSSLRRTLFVLSLSVFLIGGFQVAAANALTGDAILSIEEAEEAYEAGDYSRTITLANEELRNEDASPLVQIAAYRLLALAHSAQGDTAEARAATDNLVRIFPAYETREGDTTAFTALVEESKVRYANGELAREKKKSRIPQSIYTGAAVVMSAIVLYVGAQSM